MLNNQTKKTGALSPNKSRMINLQQKFDTMENHTNIEHIQVKNQFLNKFNEFCFDLDRQQDINKQ